jgi:hypothetical protein
MYDWPDQYLNKCIKNWVAHYQPLPGSKERLMRAAISPPVQRDRKIGHWLAIFVSVFSGHPAYFSSKAAIDQPYSHTSLWSFHISTNWHLAH